MNGNDMVMQYGKMLKNIDTWLEKATEHAKTRNFSVDNFVQSRLAPDMYTLDRQIQSACDSAKFGVAHMAGKEAPANPDTEKTVAELRTRIRTTLGFLETISAADLNGWEDRKVTPKWLGGKSVKGEVYAFQVSLPNFYFHVTTAYAILRHNGVELGKTAFIGNFPMID